MTDTKVTDGRAVEIITERMGDGPPLNLLLFVAVADDQERENIARKYAGEISDMKVRSLGSLSAENVVALGMRPRPVNVV